MAQGIRIFVGDSSGFVSMAKVGQMEVQLLRSSGGKVVFLETGPDFVESWLQHGGRCIPIKPCVFFMFISSCLQNEWLRMGLRSFCCSEA